MSRKKVFMFEASWAEKADCNDVIQNCWLSNTLGSQLLQLRSNIYRCMDELTKWNRCRTNNNKVRISAILNQLNEVQCNQDITAPSQK